MVMHMWLGLLIPFLGTTLGSGMVYFMKTNNSPMLSKCFSGLASGVMVAASIWSLLLPSLEQASSFIPSLVGLWIGTLFLLLLDHVIPHFHVSSNEEEGPKNHLKKTTKLVLAVTLHNIPEGMAVGVVLASMMHTQSISFMQAMALSIGIAIQNFPEGAILSLPLQSHGLSKTKAFLIGSLSGIVEPLFGYITILFSKWILMGLPYFLSFAAGAMLYVVVEELVPEMAEGHHSNLPTMCFMAGFSLMMVLDIVMS